MNLAQNAFHSARGVRALFAFVTALGGAFAQTQAATDIAIGPAVLQPAVKRLGINLGIQTFYDSGQMTRNLVSRNPGFEGEIFQSTIRCATGTVTTCVDDNPYSGWPSGFWNGATVEFFYGRAVARRETVAFYTAAQNNVGGTFTFLASGVAPATGDQMIVRRTIPGNADAGWWPVVSGSGAIATNLTDLPPGTAGKQTIALRVPNENGFATLTSYFDSTDGRSFVALNGQYQVKFLAKGVGGSNAIVLSLQRSGRETYLSQVVQLTDRWDSYTVTFSAAETAGLPGSVGLTFGTQGQDSFLLDDVSLVKIDSDPENETAFRDEVVDSLRALNPGVLRFWSSQLGDTLDNLIAGQYARQRSGYSAYSNQQADISYGLPEFLHLCETLGAEPWFVLPVTFSTVEAARLIEYLAGSESTVYGAKRAAAGRAEPWVTAFSKIHLEFGNEAWNGIFKGGVIEYSAPYGQRAQAIFGAMRADKSYVPAGFDLVLGGQSVAPFRNQDIQNNCNNNDSFAIAPYMMNTVDSFATNEALFGSAFAEAEAFVSTTGTAEGVAGGLITQNQRALAASTHPTPLVSYEMNLHTVDGSISQATLNNFASSVGGGLAVVDSMLLQLRHGVVTQALFSLPQHRFLRSDRKTVFLWGAVVDMGVTNRKRPQFLAMQLANLALSGGESPRHTRLPGDPGEKTILQPKRARMLKTTHTGPDPTWNQALTNTVQLTGAHYLQSFAFTNDRQHSLIVFNLHRTASLPITISGGNAPRGQVLIDQLTSTQITDTNEDSEKVVPTSQTVEEFAPTRALPLPPFSMTVLRWTSQPSIRQGPTAVQ